jgi:threonine 3-dehydrogenase
VRLQHAHDVGWDGDRAHETRNAHIVCDKKATNNKLPPAAPMVVPSGPRLLRRCLSLKTRLLREPSFSYPGESLSQDPRKTTSRRVLVTGSSGQIGQELVPFLRETYGANNVIASDVRAPSGMQRGSGDFVYCDVVDADNLARVVLEHGIDTIVHNASLLSAVGEQNPQLAIRVNSRGIENVLEVARQQGASVFAPSTIAVFGPTTPREHTANETIMRPTTVYGVTKVYLELLGEYYNKKFGVNFRSMRYPGIVSSKTMPGGGTTDYAVAIFYEALESNKYTSFLAKDSALPMMYMPDCLKATRMLMEAPESALTRRVYNITSMSFTPEQLALAIQKEIPAFEMSYKPDFRQAIADSWPTSLDDSDARKDWGWVPDYDMCVTRARPVAS